MVRRARITSGSASGPLARYLYELDRSNSILGGGGDSLSSEDLKRIGIKSAKRKRKSRAKPIAKIEHKPAAVNVGRSVLS